MFTWLPLLAPASLAAVAIEARPDWVVSVDDMVGVPAPQGSARVATQYLVVDDQLRFGDGTLQRYVHRSYRLVTLEALDEQGRLEIDYDPAFEQLRFHQLGIWRDGAWLDRAAAADSVEIQREEDLWRHMFDGTRTLVVVLPDVQVGDVVSYTVSIDGFNPVFDGHAFSSLEMGWSVPAARRFARVLAPDGEPVQVRAYGGAPKPSVVTEDGWTLSTWDFVAPPTPNADWSVPADVVVSPWVSLSTFRSWGQVVEWALPLYSAADAPAAELLELAGAHQGATQRATATELTTWVQDEIRYFGIELGERSHAPHDPLTVLQRRYGDCKDKTLLLVSLLRLSGIEAWPALVLGEGGAFLEHSLPMPGAFDHVVVEAVVDGEAVWIDPTDHLQGGPVGQRAVDDFRYALVLRAGEQALTVVDRGAEPLGIKEVHSVYRVDGEGTPPELSVRSLTTGREADDVRAWLATTSEGDMAEQFRRFYTLDGVQPEPLERPRVTDDRQTGVLEIREHYRLLQAWTPDTGGDGQVFRPFPVETLGLLPLPLAGARWPLSLPLGEHQVETVTIHAPPDWDWEPVEQRVVSRWFEFSRSGAPTPDGYEERYELRVTADRVEVADFDEYRTAALQVRDTTELVLGNGGEDPEAIAMIVTAIVVLVAGGLSFAGPLVPLAALGFMAAALFVHARRRARRQAQAAAQSMDPE